MAEPARKSTKRNVQEAAPSIGDVAKEKYDNIFLGIGKFLWKGAKQIIDSNFGRGMFFTALAIVAVMAIVPSWMGPTGSLTIGGVQPAAEMAAGSGIGHALRFLSPINLGTAPGSGYFNLTSIGTLLAGGLAGRYLLPKAFRETPAMDVRQAEVKAKELEAARARAPQQGTTLNSTKGMEELPVGAADAPQSRVFRDMVEKQRSQASAELS